MKAKSKHYDEHTAQSVVEALKAMQTDPSIQPERHRTRLNLKAVVKATAQDIRSAYEAGYSLEQITAALRAKAQVEVAPKTLRQYLAEAGCGLRPGNEDNTATHTATTTASAATETTIIQATSRPTSPTPKPKRDSGGIDVMDDVH